MKAFLTALPCLVILYVSPCLGANSVVVDSFTEGAFDFLGPKTLHGTPVIIMGLNALRDIRAGPRTTPVIDILRSTLNTSQGVFTFFSNDSPLSASPQNLNVGISYRMDTLFDATAYSGVAFEFTDLEGTGDLVIEIGFGPSSYTSATISTPITEPGWLEVPMEAINYSTRGNNTLNAFSSIHFTFRATSPTFGFTLHEIALTAVPEPSSAALFSGMAAFIHGTRRGRRGGR